MSWSPLWLSAACETQRPFFTTRCQPVPLCPFLSFIHLFNNSTFCSCSHVCVITDPDMSTAVILYPDSTQWSADALWPTRISLGVSSGLYWWFPTGAEVIAPLLCDLMLRYCFCPCNKHAFWSASRFESAYGVICDRLLCRAQTDRGNEEGEDFIYRPLLFCNDNFRRMSSSELVFWLFLQSDHQC